MKRIAFIIVTLIVLTGLGIAAYFFWRSQPVTQLPPATSFHLLILGDSVADGVGSVESENSLSTQLLQDIRTRYVDVTVENKAVSGSKTEEVLSNQLTTLQRDHYTAALLVVGTNDITHLVTPSKFESNYSAIISLLSAKADVVILANIPQFSNTPIVPENVQTIADFRTKSYNNKIDSLANSYSNVRIFNFFTFSQNKLRGETNYIAADGFHPNDDGYRLIAEEVSRKIFEK